MRLGNSLREATSRKGLKLPLIGAVGNQKLNVLVMFISPIELYYTYFGAPKGDWQAWQECPTFDFATGFGVYHSAYYYE